AAVAFEIRYRSLEQRHAADAGAEALGIRGKLVRTWPGEMARELRVGRGEHVDRKIFGVAEHRRAVRAAREAPEHHRRVERHRAEGVHRQADALAAGAERRDQADAGREAAERAAEILVVEFGAYWREDFFPHIRPPVSCAAGACLGNSARSPA